MFAKALVNQGHVRRFTVSEAGREGWEVRVEEDSALIRCRAYTDWHRVERAIGALELEVAALEREGWQETHATY